MKTGAIVAWAAIAFAMAASAADLYVSTNSVHPVEGSELGWGTYRTDDNVDHNAYTNLQQAVNAAALNDTVWVENGFVCDDANGYSLVSDSKIRLKIPRKIILRGRSGNWQNGPVIRGRWHCDVSGGTSATGLDAIRGVLGAGSTLIGIRIERCSMNGYQSSNAFGDGSLSNCCVSGCSAVYNNMYLVKLYHCVVTNCSASTYAGLFQNGSAYKSLFINNFSGGTCGAYLSSGNVVSNCVFTGNTTTTPIVGCAAANPAIPPLVIDCVFSNNTSTCIGSQYGNNYALTLRNCRFTGNSGACVAPMYGKASGRYNNRVFAYDCIFTNNSGNAAVIYTCGAFYNCLVANNTHTGSDGSILTNPDVDTPLYLFNCTVYGNRAANGYGGVRGNTVAVNTIVQANISKAGYTDRLVAATNCCVEANAVSLDGQANITSAARLVNPAASLYTPSELSPCYAGGRTNAYALTATDLAGRPRMTDGRVAIGAYEYDPANHYFAISATLPTYLVAPATVTLDSDISGFGFAPVFYWDLDGDGVADAISDSPRLVHVFNPGVWQVSLSVSNLATGVGATLAYDPFTIVARSVRYVKNGNAGAAAPYTSEATAAADIQTAIAACADSDEVIILPGVYTNTVAVKVDKDLIVHGSTGKPEDVVIHQTQADRCLWVCGGRETLVHSFTVENGRRENVYDYGSGVYLATGDKPQPDYSYSPTAAFGIVSNLVVRTCSNSSKYCAGPGVYAVGPDALVTHCVISNCYSGACYIDGGYAFGLGLHLMGGARAENCLIAGNYTAGSYGGNVLTTPLTNAYVNGNFHSAAFVGSGSVMRFCTVAKNRASFCGGINVEGSGRFEDCIIAGNTVLCQYLADHANGERLRVWSAFPYSPNHVFFRGTGADAATKEACYASFTNIVAQEQARIDSAAYYAIQTTNAVDTMGHGLGAGTVVGTQAALFRHFDQGDYTISSGSPACDAGPRREIPGFSTGDLLGNPRFMHGAYDLGCYECQAIRGTLLLVR